MKDSPEYLALESRLRTPRSVRWMARLVALVSR